MVSKANAPTVSSIAMDTSQDSDADIDDVTDNLEYFALAEYEDFGLCSTLNLDSHYDDDNEEEEVAV